VAEEIKSSGLSSKEDKTGGRTSYKIASVTVPRLERGEQRRILQIRVHKGVEKAWGYDELVDPSPGKNKGAGELRDVGRLVSPPEANSVGGRRK